MNTKKKVFVGEDDHAIIEVIKIILQDAQYEVVGSTEGTTVIKEVTNHMPQLILLDIWMSGEDGGEIAKHLKNNPITKNIPIIMISANNETEHIAKLAGANGFLQKPFNMEDLLTIVEKHIL